MIWFWIWLAGLIAVQVAGRLALRSERTAHGQIIGRRVLLVIGVFWPVALFWFLLIGGGYCVYRLLKRLRLIG